MDNLEIYNKLRTPPEGAKKTITGGRLNGMTDINPQWRIHALTSVFGPCGKGWGYEVMNITEKELDGQVALFVHVTLWTETKQQSVNGYGGSMLIAKEKGGLRLNDEAQKMAITDAIGNAAKYLGVGADVFSGNQIYDTKYEGETLASYIKKKLASVKEYQEILDLQDETSDDFRSQTGSDKKVIGELFEAKKKELTPSPDELAKKFREAKALNHLKNIKAKYVFAIRGYDKSHQTMLKVAYEEMTAKLGRDK